MAKFKIGDRVRCIRGDVFRGVGWKKDLEFKIQLMTVDSQQRVIYWKGRHGGGVFEDSLELVEPKISGPFNISRAIKEAVKMIRGE